jgi:NAD-dependent histone deacetylase SIR2
MFAVSPKTDCPHLQNVNFSECSELLTRDVLTEPCLHCRDPSENWLCLECQAVFCSRYVNGHMATHCSEEDHATALSFSDGSVWCYKCDSYVISAAVSSLTEKLGNVKFPNEEATEGANPEAKGPESGEHTQTSALPISSFTYEHLVEGLRGETAGKTFKKVAFMTGAGISVAAGIPDFRTPGTGLYAKVEELGLPYPEAIFSLDYLRSTPEPFFKIANGFLTYKARPVKAHHFIKKFADEGKLLVAFTQNIDGLELEAGLPEQLLLQAHGHMRTAHCIECRASAPIADFFEHVAREEVFYCAACADSTPDARRGIIKPDVVFFGEKLPSSFLMRMRDITCADLVFVMGTSLKVFPFAALLDFVAPGVPIVLVNRENPGAIDTSSHPMLFLQGDIEDSVTKLARDLGWELPVAPHKSTEEVAERASAIVAEAFEGADQTPGGQTPPPVSGEKA